MICSHGRPRVTDFCDESMYLCQTLSRAPIIPLRFSLANSDHTPPDLVSYGLVLKHNTLCQFDVGWHTSELIASVREIDTLEKEKSNGPVPVAVVPGAMSR